MVHFASGKFYHRVFGKENIKEIFRLLYTKMPCQSYSKGSRYGKYGICRAGTLRNLRDSIGKNSDIDINCIDSGSMFIRLYKAQTNSIEAILIKHWLQWSKLSTLHERQQLPASSLLQLHQWTKYEKRQCLPREKKLWKTSNKSSTMTSNYFACTKLLSEQKQGRIIQDKRRRQLEKIN